MLASIHPLGERVRRNRFGVTATAFTLAGAAGGAVLGAVAGAAGVALRSAGPPGGGWVIGLVATAAMAALVADVNPARLPTLRRQVDERWLDTYRGWVYGGGFGFQLGLGVVTIVTSAATYLTILLAVLAPSFPTAVAVGVTYGAGRGLMVWPGAGLRDQQDLRRFHRRLDSLRARARLATLGWLGAVALAAIGLLIGGLTG